jgi:F-type H+-transporting ATPase subunit epsilon
MKLKIITPERTVFEEDNVDAVYAKSTDGEVGILPKHIPMVCPLAIGVLRYVKAGQKQAVAVMGGLLRTDGQEISILADAAELGREIDRVQAEQDKAEAEALLKQKVSGTDLQRVETELARALIRLKASEPIH